MSRTRRAWSISPSNSARAGSRSPIRNITAGRCENRAHLMPTREQSDRAYAAVEARREHYRGTVVIDHVAPDYHAQVPQGLHERLGAADAQRQRRPARCCRAIPPRSFRASSSGARAKGRSPKSGRIRRRSRRFAASSGCRSPAAPASARRIDFGGCRCQAMALLGDAAAMRSDLHEVAASWLVGEIAARDSRRRGRRFCAAPLCARAGFVNLVRPSA